MTITSVDKDLKALTMTITAQFNAPIERVWEMWENPRLLERWWGPPTYPATVVDHDLSPGGGVSYFMTGPEGDGPHGWWRIVAVDAPRRLEFESGLADDLGEPKIDMPTMMVRVDFDEGAGGDTRMVIVTAFPSLEAMEQMLSMGMEEGSRSAVAQIDDIL
jgi:uncharacterized protein YndB with AHSA1/START domain